MSSTRGESGSGNLRSRAVAAMVLAASCGGITADDDASTDSGADAGSPCVLVTGDVVYALCNGTNGCSPPDPQNNGLPAYPCDYCLAPPGQAGICSTKSFSPAYGTPAVDGYVYVDLEPSSAWAPVPFAVGDLLGHDGGGTRVRYADWLPWDGSPLPDPATCPAFANFSICGASCGSCAADEICTGRSPKNEYGICVPSPQTEAPCTSLGNWACPSGLSCLVFDATQLGQGFCVPTAGCLQAQSSYPGGNVTCH